LVGASKRDLVAVVRGAPAGPKLHRHRLAGRSGDREEWYWRHHDGSTIPTSVASRPLVDRAGRRVGTLLSIADMSERRELESQLGRVQELVEAGELSARLAHEVEGCIAAVIADLERLELSAGAERTLRARAQAAVETARRGEAL